MAAKSILQGVLVYGILIFGGTVVAVLVAVGAALVLPPRTHPGLPLLATSMAALFLALGHSPVNRIASRLLQRKSPEPNPSLERLARRLEGNLDPNAVLSAIVEVVAQVLRPQHVAVYVNRLDAEGPLLVAHRSGGRDDAGAAHDLPPSGNPTTNSGLNSHQVPGQLSFPLVHRSQVVGRLVVVPDEQRPLTPQDQHLLGIIAHRAGWAADVVHQAHDLRLARERLVLAREEERRRLRRNLHDTIGPTLAALSLKAGSVRAVIERDPGAAQEAMTELRSQIQTVITDIRRLAYDLRPPALDELGMLPAIVEQARQFSTGSLEVSVDAPDRLPALPAALEVAVYRIAMEALTNVQRHSGARHCRIRLSMNDSIEIEVIDDGVGLPVKYRAGVGIASMHERATELGGFCSIESQPGRGTRVLASLPLSYRTGRERVEPAGRKPSLFSHDRGS